MIHSICEFKTKPFLSRVPIFTDPERTVPMGFHRDPRTSPWQPLTLNVSTCFLGCFLQCPSIQVNGMRPKTSSDEAIVLGANLIQSRNTILKVWPDIEKAKDLESNSTHSIQINTRQARIFWEAQFGIHSSLMPKFSNWHSCRCNRLLSLKQKCIQKTASRILLQIALLFLLFQFKTRTYTHKHTHTHVGAC